MDQEAGAQPYTWTVRVRGGGGQEATVSARNHSFQVCAPVSFHEADSHPSALEYLLGALGGDLITGFADRASRRGITVDALEIRVSGRLHNPLVYLGVVGETRRAGVETITSTLYVSADADEETLRQIWEELLSRSPLVNTLQEGVALSLEMRTAP